MGQIWNGATVSPVRLLHLRLPLFFSLISWGASATLTTTVATKPRLVATMT
jgi:hypothetical protein